MSVRRVTGEEQTLSSRGVLSRALEQAEEGQKPALKRFLIV